MAVYLPPRRVTSAEVEAMVRAESPGCPFPAGLLAHLSGVSERRFADDGVYGSDLAAAAARDVLARTGRTADDVDLLVFAAATHDVAEPATANLVQAKLGARGAAFDVKNACNSFLNGLQVAESLLQTGQYATALVVTGETPSRCICWQAADHTELKRNFPGFTLGDAGAAALLTRAEPGEAAGIEYRAFETHGRYWPLAAVLGGGSMHPRGDEHTYIRGDGAGLRAAFRRIGPGLIHRALAETGLAWGDFAAVLVHQVSMRSTRDFCRASGVPGEKIPLTLPRYGNVAAASLPLGFVQARESGQLAPGDRVLMIGLAAGLSVGVMAVTV